MISWVEFSQEEAELSDLGKRMLLQGRLHAGLAFLATIRKDGAPRLHPISLVFSQGGLYLLIQPLSPKCADLKRDGRYALQAFPSPENVEGKEFYLTGVARCIHDTRIRQAISEETAIHVEEPEVLFELLVERAMYTVLVDRGTPNEHPWHRIWPAPTR